MKIERRIDRYRYLFNIQYSLTKFKESTGPLADALMKGFLHLFVAIIYSLFLLLFSLLQFLFCSFPKGISLA